jgi:hypothetical protein
VVVQPSPCKMLPTMCPTALNISSYDQRTNGSNLRIQEIVWAFVRETVCVVFRSLGLGTFVY